jgi:hypothetical protein
MSEGTFQKLDKPMERLFGPKGLVICGYAPAEHRPLVGALSEIGFADRPLIFVGAEDCRKTMKEVLSSEDRSGIGQPSDLPRAMIMSGFTQQEVHMLMSVYRRAELPTQLWATLTPVSETWTLEALLNELAKEAEAVKKK